MGQARPLTDRIRSLQLVFCSILVFGAAPRLNFKQLAIERVRPDQLINRPRHAEVYRTPTSQAKRAFFNRAEELCWPQVVLPSSFGVWPMPSLLSALGIDRLSVAERLQLVEEIWDSIAPTVEQFPLTEAQRNELDRRVAALNADPTNVIPWEEVEARARARFQK
jgi:putative addiction module component (TIGR02574 family)